MNPIGIPVLKIGSILIASLQVELKDTVVAAFQQNLLSAIEKEQATGLVIDVTGTETVDTFVAKMLVATSRMAKLMGVDTVLVGMRAETAATLTRMGYSFPDLKTALNLEDGLKLLRSFTIKEAG